MYIQPARGSERASDVPHRLRGRGGAVCATETEWDARASRRKKKEKPGSGVERQGVVGFVYGSAVVRGGKKESVNCLLCTCFVFACACVVVRVLVRARACVCVKIGDRVGHGGAVAAGSRC